MKFLRSSMDVLWALSDIHLFTNANKDIQDTSGKRELIKRLDSSSSSGRDSVKLNFQMYSEKIKVPISQKTKVLRITLILLENIPLWIMYAVKTL